MAAYQGRREFRAGGGAIIATVLTALVFAAGVVMTYRLHGWYWVSIVLICGLVLALAGIIETLVLKVQLTDEAMLSFGWNKPRVFPRPYCSRTDAG
jgi:ABC-type uncharacterized transport system permease subunit